MHTVTTDEQLSAARKNTPLYSGCMAYFPDALQAVARLSKVGNDKHNPGQPLHWSKDKSADHADCLARHLLDAGKVDPETGLSHTVSVAWRALALLQTEIEKQRGEQTPSNVPPKPGAVVYRDVADWPGYCVGDDGTVWSSRRCPEGMRRELKQKRDDRGYRWVTLQDKPRKRMVKVGTLVLETFVGPRPDGEVVRHLNDNPADNHLVNLTYGTHADNAEDARRNGRLCEGESHGCSKYTEDQVREVRRLRAEGKTYGEIETATGVKRASVVQIATGRQWASVDAPKRRPRTYIAGPISKGDLQHNIEQATAAFKQLAKAGAAAWCPQWSAFSGGAEGDGKLGQYNRYDGTPRPWAHASTGGVGLSHREWLETDLAWVECADAVLRLPGESTGADEEVALAKSRGIPVFYSVEEVAYWIRNGKPIPTA
jgi:hypothetical protein